MLLLTHKTANFSDAIAMDKAQKDCNKAAAAATVAKAQAWENKGYRKASACITVVAADPIKLAEKKARIARKNAIIAEQKRLFDDMLKAFNLENDIIAE